MLFLHLSTSLLLFSMLLVSPLPISSPPLILLNSDFPFSFPGLLISVFLSSFPLFFSSRPHSYFVFFSPSPFHLPFIHLSPSSPLLNLFILSFHSWSLPFPPLIYPFFSFHFSTPISSSLLFCSPSFSFLFFSILLFSSPLPIPE